MRHLPDPTGRVPYRPYYEPGELDAECESIVRELLVDLHGSVRFPIQTDDLVSRAVSACL